MKDLSIYIKESQADGKNGHWENRTDSNGILTRTWVDYEELARQRKAKEAELKKAAQEKEEARKKKIEEKRKLQQELEELENEMKNLDSELSDLYMQYSNLEIDQEEEVGGLYAAGEEEEAEKLAQEFGDQFNELEKNIESTQKEMEKIEKRMAEIEKQLYK